LYIQSILKQVLIIFLSLKAANQALKRSRASPYDKGSRSIRATLGYFLHTLNLRLRLREIMPDTKTNPAGVVGKGVARLDAEDKVRGRSGYVDDLEIPGCWIGHLVRSLVPHGRLRGLKRDPYFDWSRVVVATPKDIPGINVVVMHDRSMPLLAFDEVRYLGEPLALVAAPTARLASEAAASITPEIDALTPILTLNELVSLFKSEDPRLFRLSSQTIVKGDVEKGLSEADHVVEGEYTAGHQEQLYLEPQGMVALPEANGGVFIQGSLQCPYYVVQELHEALNLPPGKIRVKQAAVGGAFGGKEDFPTLLGGYCALLALKSGRPVKIVFDRNQDIRYTTKRHPAWVRHRTGLKKDGTITAMRVDYLLDGGAYLTLSDVVMYRGMLHAAMGYRCENIFVNGLVARTNTFPSGAFRGFGAPQAIWGLESHIDKLAQACGMEPHEFRLKNGLRLGDTTPTGQVLEEMGAVRVLDEALKKSGFDGKIRRCSHGRRGEKKWYGIGVSFFAHGSGFTGDGESRIGTKAALDLDFGLDAKPLVSVRVSSTEIGQGSATALSQIAADELSVGIESVGCPYPDTALVPNSGPTVASRTTMIVGATVHGAAVKMKKALEEYASDTFFKGQSAVLKGGFFRCGSKTFSFQEVAGDYLKQEGPLHIVHQFTLPPTIKWDQKTFRGDAYPGYSWGCNVAEVEVDPVTLEIHLKRVTSCYDIGRVINPLLAKGQIEGGLTQAAGYALMEKIGIKGGRFDADRLQTYIIPTALDIPEYEIHFIEFPYEHAAPGAKGVGEIPMDGLAPATANAVYQATGLRMTDLPITPEKLYERLNEKR